MKCAEVGDHLCAMKFAELLYDLQFNDETPSDEQINFAFADEFSFVHNRDSRFDDVIDALQFELVRERVSINNFG